MLSPGFMAKASAATRDPMRPSGVPEPTPAAAIVAAVALPAHMPEYAQPVPQRRAVPLKLTPGVVRGSTTRRAAALGNFGALGGTYGGRSDELFRSTSPPAPGSSNAQSDASQQPRGVTAKILGSVGLASGDDAASAAELAVDTDLTAEQQRAVIRKVTWRLVPFVSFLYFLAFLDRSNIGASHYPLKEDLNISEDDFASAVGIFFFGYVLFELPSNLLLRRLGAHVWLSAMVACWGLVCLCMAFVKDLNGLLTARFFLGVAEGGFFPGILLYLSRWFVDRELASRLVVLSIASAAAGVLGGIFGFVFLRMDGLGGLQGWQWLFLLEGLPSMLLGVAVYLWLPPDPTAFPGLTPSEISFLVRRIERQDHVNRWRHQQRTMYSTAQQSSADPTAIGSTGDEALLSPADQLTGRGSELSPMSDSSSDGGSVSPRNGSGGAAATEGDGAHAVSGRVHWPEVWATVSDPRVLLMAAINLCLLTPMYSLAFFTPAIIEQFGYNFLGSNLLSSPVALVGGCVSLANSLHSDATRERFWHIIIPAGFLSITFFLQAGAMNAGDKGFEFFFLFLNAWSSCVISPCLALLTSFLHSSTQVAVASAVVVSVANAGGYIGPKLFALAFERSGSYWPAMIAMALFELIAVLLLLVLRWYVGRADYVTKQNAAHVLSDNDFDAVALTARAPAHDHSAATAGATNGNGFVPLHNSYVAPNPSPPPASASVASPSASEAEPDASSALPVAPDAAVAVAVSDTPAIAVETSGSGLHASLAAADDSAAIAVADPTPSASEPEPDFAHSPGGRSAAARAVDALAELSLAPSS